MFSTEEFEALCRLIDTKCGLAIRLFADPLATPDELEHLQKEAEAKAAAVLVNLWKGLD